MSWKQAASSSIRFLLVRSSVLLHFIKDLSYSLGMVAQR